MNAWFTVSLCVREYHSVHVCEYMCECECMWVCVQMIVRVGHCVCQCVSMFLYVTELIYMYLCACSFMWICELDVWVIYKCIYEHICFSEYTSRSVCKLIRVWVNVSVLDLLCECTSMFVCEKCASVSIHVSMLKGKWKACLSVFRSQCARMCVFT